jgi:hypothetical protein
MHWDNRKKACNIVAGKAERKRLLWRERRRQNYNIKMDLKISNSQGCRPDLFSLG